MTGQAEEDTSVQDDAEFLASEDEPEVEEQPEETPEVEEEVEEQEEELPKEEPEDDTDPVVAKDAAKTITAKYPNLFKEFPDLRKALFQSEYFSQVFPTVELAKEAAQKVEHFEMLGAQLIEGDAGALLDSIHDIDGVGPEAVAKLAENFLPILFSRSEQLFQKAVQPVFTKTIAEMRAQAIREKNKPLFLTAQNLSLWLFGQKEVKEPVKQTDDPEKIQLRQQVQQAQTQREQTFVAAAKAEIDTILTKEINSKIAASVPSNLRDLLTEKVIREIGATMRKNPGHVQLVNRLGEQAKRSGFSPEHKKAIVQAYIKPARALIGKILAQHAGETKQPVQTKNLGQGSGAPAPEGKIDAKKVDWSKTTEKDFLAGKVVYKK